MERAENALQDLGFREFRVRALGRTARIEVAAEEKGRLADAELVRRVVTTVVAAGFHEAFVDEEPFRSGRLSGAIRRRR